MARASVGKASDLPPGQATAVECGGEMVAVFNIDGRYFACSDACPHAGGPLHQGFVEGTTVVCPWHGWDFELDCGGVDPRDGVIRYEVVEEAGELFIEKPGN